MCTGTQSSCANVAELLKPTPAKDAKSQLEYHLGKVGESVKRAEARGESEQDGIRQAGQHVRAAAQAMRAHELALCNP